jgi:DNA-directed RNA polymerase subunit RPC12/RpoP
MATLDPLSRQWQPPANYQAIASAVEGITVFAPGPEEKLPDSPITYQCPNCGATTRYDVSAGGIACEHCGYTAATKAQQVGTLAESFEFSLDNLRNAAQGWGVERRELFCDNCGAAIILPENTLTATCPFCASNKVNVRSTINDHLRPWVLVPFKVTAEVTRSRAAEWLGKGWYHPKELANSAVVDRFSGIYLPFWTFGARISSRWTAEVGYERTERYYDSSDNTWKTRTVLDWRRENGDVSITINDLLISGSTHISKLILERLLPFELNDLVTYTPDFLAGWQAHTYDIPLTTAWEEGKNRMRESARQACNKDIPTSHVRNFSMTADFKDETWRFILLPVYIAVYRYENRVYQVMVNGQTATVAGQKPVAWWKIWIAIAGLLAPGLILGLIGLPLLLAAGTGIVPLALGGILLVIGGILAFMLYQQAVASEAS